MSIYQKFCTENFDDKGLLTEFSLNFPDNFNFSYDVVDAIAKATPDKQALVWCDVYGNEKRFSFGEISRLSNKAATVFLEGGIKKGDIVMVMLKRHYEYWYVAVALEKIGAVMAPVTHMLTADDIVYRLKAGKMSAAVCTCSDNAPQKFLEANSQYALSNIFTVRADIENCVNLTKAIENAEELSKRVDTFANEPMLAYFTSGTTGYPKGVLHNHSYPLAHIVTAKHWQQAFDGGLHFTVAETGWAKTSWGKIYGQWLVESAVMVFDFDNFEPRQLMNVINKYKVTTFCAPPTIYRYLIKSGLQPMPSLTHACTAGEPMSPDVFDSFRQQTGLSIAEGYGQTETTPILANFVGAASKPGSMGKPNPLYNVALVDSDLNPVAPGVAGEIIIYPNKDGGVPIGLFYNYAGNDGLFENVWRGGAYHTFDTARIDEDGYYWFIGRSDDVIKTGGYRVGPFEVEKILSKHPSVLECSVIGVPDVLRGQAIKAFVVLAKGYAADNEMAKELKKFCNSRCSEYKWIRKLEFVEKLPKTISGKVMKKDLKERGDK